MIKYINNVRLKDKTVSNKRGIRASCIVFILCYMLFGKYRFETAVGGIDHLCKVSVWIGTKKLLPKLHINGCIDAPIIVVKQSLLHRIISALKEKITKKSSYVTFIRHVTQLLRSIN